MIGWRWSVGINGCEEWILEDIMDEVELNNCESKVMEDYSESSGVVALMIDDWGDFRMYSSIDLLASWTSIYAINSGSKIVS